jgi:hypothetical protein
MTYGQIQLVLLAELHRVSSLAVWLEFEVIRRQPKIPFQLKPMSAERNQAA